MEDLKELQVRQIEALQKMVKIQEDFISLQAERIDQLGYDYANAKAKYNMLLRNIEAVDLINQ
jgi:hypothetical protein